jgi:hypothetical protein
MFESKIRMPLHFTSPSPKEIRGEQKRLVVEDNPGDGILIRDLPEDIVSILISPPAEYGQETLHVLSKRLQSCAQERVIRDQPAPDGSFDVLMVMKTDDRLREIPVFVHERLLKRKFRKVIQEQRQITLASDCF